MLDLSIIIVNYNTRELTLSCIDSIKKSKTKFRYEVIVVDNGSSDGSVQEFRNYNSKLKLIENKVNLGFAKACNQGIRISKGKYFLLLNSDTLANPQALDALVKFAEDTPDLGVVGAKLINIDGGVQNSVYHFPTLTNAFREYWLGEKGLFGLYAPKADYPIEVDSVVGAAFLITTKAIKKVGLLNEKYFMYYEDLDYCRSVKKMGLKIYYLPSANIIHYHGASGRNLVKPEFQWKRLIPSSKIYHGVIMHHLINFVIWSGLKLFKRS